ncbi:hypothetical protein NESM_000063100 [Novymonas esmeraldas]|uniref:Uncharacterized protein n=1 Tax=Novymonas esmeraldas TaxID=1808958 RepID=A0AAW0F1U2_9TRYP
MQRVSVSKDGRLAWGSSFASCHGDRVPAAIRLLQKDGAGDALEPDWVAFSAFDVTRPASVEAKTNYSAGDHAALAFNGSGSFVAVAVVRCDTWAVQWAVEKAACLADASVSQVVALCANTVCGVATPSGSSSSSPKHQYLFVASRFDVPTMSRKENKEWRQFTAAPRRVETGLESEGLVSIAAFDKNTLLVLTAKGSLALVRFDVRAMRTQAVPAACELVRVERLECRLQPPSKSSRTVVYNDGKGTACAVAFAPSVKAVELVHFRLAAAGEEAAPARTTATAVRVVTRIPADDVCFVGPFHIAISCARKRDNLQFVGLVPGPETLDTMEFDPLTAPHVPLAAFYSEPAEELVLISASQDLAAFAALPSAQKVTSLVEATLSFSSGPFSQASLSKTSWELVSNPFRHYGPQTRRYAEEGRSDDEEEDLQVVQSAGARGAGRWTPVTLCYALAARHPSSSATQVAVFAVETAPFLHTRLIKQWHNATAGLKMILDVTSASSSTALALPWNPRHVRRALRLFSQAELSSLLHRVAATVAASERVSSPVSYPDATTTAVEVALHTVTLARQMGAALMPEDVRTIAILLRAARESGHELSRYTSRMELLMESHLQRRAMNRVLQRRTATHSAADEVAQSLAGDFYGIAAELQTERTLHTRYASNAWAQHLGRRKGQYQAEAKSAAQLLAMVAPSEGHGAADATLSDWRRLGSAPHQDPLLDQFERALL